MKPKESTARATGKKFGRLFVERVVFTPREKTKAECVCDCGKSVVVGVDKVLNGHTKSCGCYRSEVSAARVRTHGKSRTRVYTAYWNMINRCYYKALKGFKYWGGKGIRVCSRWLEPNGVGFMNFYADMGDPPDGLSLERKLRLGHYCPENCEWATVEVQNNNKESNIQTVFNGVSRNTTQWSRIKGIKRTTLWQRLYRYSWEAERALTAPVEYYHPHKT